MIETNDGDTANKACSEYRFYPQIPCRPTSAAFSKRVDAFHYAIANSVKCIIYILTNNNISKSLHFFDLSSKVLTKENLRKAGNKSGVSKAIRIARTQMAENSPRISRFSALAGSAMGALTALTPVSAIAEDAVPTGLTHAEELEQLGQANRQAFDYAREHGVAIVLHMGDDMRNHEQPEALQAWLEQQFRDRFAAEGINVGIFPRVNLNAAASGVTYHVGNHIYEPPGQDPILNLQEAMDYVTDVAEQGRIAIQLAQASIDNQPTPVTPGG